MNTLIPKAKVKVYLDAATHSRFEDVVKLKSKIRDVGDGFEEWHVTFDGSATPQTRIVHPQNVLQGRNKVHRLHKAGRAKFVSVR
jgi:hypothetical protein